MDSQSPCPVRSALLDSPCAIAAGPETKGANWMAIEHSWQPRWTQAQNYLFVLQVFSKMRVFGRSCRSQRYVKSLALRNLAEREGFESAVKRSFNDMQGSG